MKELLVEDENGDRNVKVEQKAYVESIIEQFKVPAITSPTQGSIAAPKVLKHIIETLTKGDKPVEDGLIEQIPEAYAQIVKDINANKALLGSEADKAKQEKADAAAAAELKKTEKAAAAEALKVTQGEFSAGVSGGVDTALALFQGSVDTLASKLPEGITVAQEGAGFGVKIVKGTSPENMGKALGVFYGAAEGNKWMAANLQFLVGDMAAAAVEAGVWADAKTASKEISAYLESQGKKLSPISVDTYRRLSERIPIEDRNPKADPTAYLAIAQVKVPKKGDAETPEAFKIRKDALEADLKGLRQELATGAITDRKSVLPKILEVEYNRGLKTRPDPDAVKPPSLSELLGLFFKFTTSITNLANKHTEGAVVFLAKDGIGTEEVQVSDLETKLEEVKASLYSLLFKDDKKGIEPIDFFRGFQNVKEQVPVATDAAGKAITEEQITKKDVYYPIFFDVAHEDEGAAEATDASATDTVTETPPAEAEGAAAKKAAKKTAEKKV